MAADVFRKSYRQYLALKPKHYRWSHLAPQSVRHLEQAVNENWSVEKIADYLHCDPVEAEACLGRYIMSKKVNAKDTTAGRLREAVFQWIGEVADLDEETRRRLAGELCLMVGNQLFAAAQAKEEMMGLSLELEGEGLPEPNRPDTARPMPDPGSEPPPKWGPQWKD